MPKSSELKTQLSKLYEELSSSGDSKAVAEKALALAKTTIDALENSEREIKIFTGC